MLRAGEKQTLRVQERTEHGVYLVPGDPDGKETERVLLPRRYVPDGVKPGDPVEVFLYFDSEDRLVATTQTPALMPGQVGRLIVRETNRIGAFLDWGLPKDLLLPFANQTKRVKKGESVLCTVLTDKSGRLVAAMNVYEALETQAPYRAGDWAEGCVYEKSDNFGAFVAVDDRYSGLIPKKELVGEITVGQQVRVRIARVQPDGRLSLSLREKAYLQMDTDADRIMQRLAAEGRIPFTDKASPELIREQAGMSKNEFKRAVGRLLKQGRIRITVDGIVPADRGK
ncbi:MAG: S1 RNA-binding domain-containing protein [Lachnospiraceae bacterium]|nr:S1 RNA-binding domain-containing protein [Lachnospiraceae bacterium]